MIIYAGVHATGNARVVVETAPKGPPRELSPPREPNLILEIGDRNICPLISNASADMNPSLE